eukprot:2147944-Amphidinium_carterae.2
MGVTKKLLSGWTLMIHATSQVSSMTVMRQAYHQVSNREGGTGVNSLGQHGITFRHYPSADGGTGRSNLEPLGIFSRAQQQLHQQDASGRDLLQQQVGYALQPLQQFNDALPLPRPGSPFQVSAVQIAAVHLLDD